MTRRYGRLIVRARRSVSSARDPDPAPAPAFLGRLGFFGLAVLIFFIASPIVCFHRVAVVRLAWLQRRIHDSRSLQIGWSSAVRAGLPLPGRQRESSRSECAQARAARGRDPALDYSRRRRGHRSRWGGLVALVLSGGAGTSGRTWHVPARPTDRHHRPVLGQDVSFYLLTLPSCIRSSTGARARFLTALLVGFVYAWRGDAFDLNLTPRRIAHLSALLAVFSLVLARGCGSALRPAVRHTAMWSGAAYTDVNARLPIVTFLSGAAIVFAGALLVNVWLRRLWLPVIAGLLWVALLLIGQIYPAVVQTAFTTRTLRPTSCPISTARSRHPRRTGCRT